MNKLREKFQDADNRSMIKSTFLDKLEQITDDFSVKLLIWIANSENTIDSIDYNQSDEIVATELQ